MGTTAAAAAVASVLTGPDVRKNSVGDLMSPSRGRHALRVFNKAAKLHHSTAREQTKRQQTKNGWRSDSATPSVIFSRRWDPVHTVHRFPKGEVVGREQLNTNQRVSTNPDVHVHEVSRPRWSSMLTVQHRM